LPPGDIQLFLLNHRQDIDKLSQSEFNEISHVAIYCMIPHDRTDKYTRFDEDVTFIIEYFRSAAFVSLLSDRMRNHIDDEDFLGYIANHAKEFSDKCNPEQLLKFLFWSMSKLILEYPEFSINSLCEQLGFIDDDKRARQFAINIHDISSGGNIKLLNGQVIAERCLDMHEFYKNKDVICSYKKSFDNTAKSVATKNLTVVRKLIDLFPDCFSAVSDLHTMTSYLKFMKLFNQDITNNMVNLDDHVRFSLMYPVLCAMRQTITNGDDMEKVLEFIPPPLCRQFITEHEEYLRQRHMNEAIVIVLLSNCIIDLTKTNFSGSLIKLINIGTAK